MVRRRPIRRIQPHERLPMHHAEVVGGDKEVALLETPGGDFKIQTRAHEYPLDADDAVQKAQIKPEDIKRLSNLEEAGIRGGIHSKRTYLMALHDGSLWIWKQTGVEERDEIFVYELAKRMFRSIVPEVQPVFVPKLGWGSAMRKVAGVPAGRVDGLHGYFHGNDEMMADLTAMLVLDYLIGNPDRHSNNWFILHNDRLAAIDNGWAGEDLTMSFADVFQPARLAGMMEDERLWPQLLKGINALIQDLSGRGDEVRALAEAVKIDRKEAVDMVRLWEPKLASMAKLIRAEAGRVEKARVYVEPGTQPPPGAQMETGPRGGTYYESEPQMPGFEQPPEERYHREEGGYTKPTTVLASVDKEETQIAALDDAESASIAEALERQPEYKGYSRHTSEVRGAVKDAITSRIAAETGLKYNTVKSYMGSWAGSSSDENVHSLAMQMAAAALFGLPATEFLKKSWYKAGGRGIMGEPGGDDTKQKRLDEASAILRVMYADTQDYLAKHGIESLVLFRGMRWFDDEGENTTPQEFLHYGRPPEGVTKLTHDLMRQESEFHANPLSSWAYSFSEARIFANFKPEGASSFEGEYAWDDPTFQRQVGEAVQAAWEEYAKEHDLPVDSYEAEEKWKAEEIEANYGSEDAWAYNEAEVMPPEMLPALTRVMSVVEVPRQKIIATALTGLGCLNEHEVVVSGGEFKQNTYVMRDYDGTEKFPHFGDIEEHEMEAGEQYQRREKPEEKPVEGPEAKPPEIPEELLAARLKEMRNDPSLDTNETYSKMSTLLFEWWTRKAEKYRQGWNEVYADTTLSDHEKTMKLAPFDLAKAIHSEDYKQRLDDAAESIGHPSPWSDDTEYAIERAYSRDRIAFLKRLVDGEIEPGEAKGIQERMYARTKVQDKINEMGYDPFDDKLVKLVAKYEAKLDALSKEKWPEGVEFSVWNKTMERKKARVRNAFNKKLGTFEKPVPVEKALRKAKGRTYLKPGQKPPEGTQEEEGPRGGRYYESEGRGAAEEPAGARAALPDMDAYWDMLETNDRYKDAGTKFAFEMGHEGPNAWKSGEVRAALKGHLASEIAHGTRMDVEIVNEFIASWASSSSDDNAYSLSIQTAVAQMFGMKYGIEPPDFVREQWENVAPVQWAKDLAVRHGKYGPVTDYKKAKELMLVAARNITRHVYEQTQEWLKEQGIEMVTLGRGQGWKGQDLPEELRGLELTDEQFGRLHSMRMEQYDWREKEALDRLAKVPFTEEQWEKERREGTNVYADYDKIRARYAEARETLVNDIERDPLAMINLIRGDAEFRITKDWSDAMNASNLKYRKPEGYANNRERDDARNAAHRDEKEIDTRFREARQEMRAGFDKMSNWTGELDFHQNPLSSWSIDHDTATAFSTMRAHGKHTAVTMWAEVPAERIISIPFTGPGCLTEHEFLVAGGKMPVHFRASAYTEGERSHDPSAIRDHLDPLRVIHGDIEAKRRGDVMQAKHFKQVAKLLAEGKIDEDEASSLRSALVSGNPKAEEMAKQSIATISGQAQA